jgi:steroid delta-isomerase-like uncharacterized protein
MSSKSSPVFENITLDEEELGPVDAFAALGPGQAPQARTQKPGPAGAAEFDRNTQSLSDIISAYFEAWNRHDADAIVATFTAGGTYQDPTTAGPLSGAAIGENAKALWEAFPDLTFTRGDLFGSGDRIAVQWHMTGTQTGPFRGLPPTGRSVGVPGADFFELSGGKIASIRGHFDSRATPDQLGLQVIVQPHNLGPFTFGTSVRAHSGSKAMPGAFGITMLERGDGKDSDEISQLALDLAVEMQPMPGLISVMLVIRGNRRLTLSAWERPEDVQDVMKNPTHKSAMIRTFKKHGLFEALHVSTWVPAHQGTMWLRCKDCGAMVDSIKLKGSCACRSRLPEPAAYW